MANQININSNGLKAWALLASMESNNVLECIKETLSKEARQSLLLQNSAQLLDIARRHLSALGKELELIAGHPNRDKIDAVLEGFSEDQIEADSDDSKVNSPVFKVRQALDSPEYFESLYLELCELAMASFKLLDRDRSAAIIGKRVENYVGVRNERFSKISRSIELVLRNE